MADCDLCGLPTPDPPITGPANAETDESGDLGSDESENLGSDESGTFCCRGCQQVAATVDDVEQLDGLRDAQGDRERGGGTPAEEVPPDASVAYFVVDGMHCTTCERFLDHRGERTDGVHRIEANYGLESARVYYDPDRVTEEALAGRLSGYGYTFRSREESDATDAWRRRQRATVQRLLVGGFFTMLIMPWYFFYLYPQYVGLGGGLLELGRTTTVGIYFPLVAIGAMTTVVFGYTGYPILRGAWVSVRTRQPNMDLLVAIAASAAYVYSVIALALGRTHLYFDVTVMVVMVVTLGRYYEGKLRFDATRRLSSITDARVNEATRLLADGRETVPVDRIQPGDSLLVKPGERVPLDGQISHGRADVDESLLTGESLPVTREAGDRVVGGSTVIDGTITVEVGPSAASTLDRIAETMWEIQSETGGVQRFADALATIFVPAVLVLGVAVTAWQLLSGVPVADALLWGLTILLVSCPCAMGLATPLAISGGLRDALAQGVVVTNEIVFERAPDADILIFDKTGTLTSGEMTVNSVAGDERTLERAATLERLASHPVADAILEANRDGTYRSRDGIDHPARADGGVRAEDLNEPASEAPDSLSEALPDVEEFREHPGSGVSGEFDGRRVVVGTPDLVRTEAGPIDAEMEEEIARIREAGRLPVVVGWDGTGRGVIEVADRARQTWADVLDGFEQRDVVILTGDDSSADEFEAHPAVDHVFTGVPPDGKTEVVRRFRADGITVMVGDGTNDAPALAAADLGIAMGEGTADASEAGDAVLVKNDLRGVNTVFELARGTRRRIRENIAWALLYNAIALPLAVAGLINPFFAAVAMALSSLVVVTNSRRAVVRD